jgi:hypothetical protein
MTKIIAYYAERGLQMGNKALESPCGVKVEVGDRLILGGTVK